MVVKLFIHYFIFEFRLRLHQFNGIIDLKISINKQVKNNIEKFEKLHIQHLIQGKRGNIWDFIKMHANLRDGVANLC